MRRLGLQKHLLLWSSLLALGLHLLLVTPYARWLQRGMWSLGNEPELDIELMQLTPPEQKQPRERWKPLPKEKKPLSQIEQDQLAKAGGQATAKAGRKIDEEAPTKGPHAETPELLEQLKSTQRGPGPEEAQANGMQFTMNSYKWTWQRYMENWAVDLGRWWMPPQDYMTGQWPEGGFVWVRVQLSKEGEMLSYKILQHNVSPEMKLMVVQALMGARLRPPLPPDFDKEYLEVSWKFIYPPLAELLNQMGAQQGKQGPRR